MKPTLPESSDIAFKEWGGVCQALASGRQTFLLRKGGIEEGPNGFVPDHSSFWLYPTWVHQGEQGLKAVDEREVPPTVQSIHSVVAIRSIALVNLIVYASKIETLLKLDDLHVWTEETVAKRFQYRRPGLWVLGLRVYNLPEPTLNAVTPEQIGCKTWVPLGAPIATRGATPAIDDQEAANSIAELRSRLQTVEIADG